MAVSAHVRNPDPFWFRTSETAEGVSVKSSEATVRDIDAADITERFVAPASLMPADLQGKKARLEIVDRHQTGSGHILVDHIVFTDSLRVRTGRSISCRTSARWRLRCWASRATCWQPPFVGTVDSSSTPEILTLTGIYDPHESMHKSMHKSILLAPLTKLCLTCHKK